MAAVGHMNGNDAKTMGEMSANVAHLTKQSDRMDADFKQFREEVRVDLTAMRKSLSDNGERLTMIRAVWLVVKLLLGAAVAIASILLGWKGLGIK